MRIRKLELNGFKSFPDRTLVEFGPGISAVVGPNGSGKSNILDAIRWVIGEQSARALRGGEMLDVIFAGSANRSAVSYAEVVLTLSADDGEPFPGEYARFSEVQVGRRLHRSGASEYFINQARCRRRDVTDLFLDTGVATDLYCFIEQGSVGKIVHATPAERRVLIEEAAGISRYKARRDEAQTRLAETAAQLDRAADVADEMSHRLRHLEGQVARVAKYRRLRARLRQREILLALARYADLAAERSRLRTAHREAERRAEEADRQAHRQLAEAEGRREEAAVVEAASHTWRDEVAEQDARIRELEGAGAFTARRAEELARSLEAAAAEAIAVDERLSTAASEQAAARADAESLERSVESLAGDLEARTDQLRAAVAEADRVREGLAGAEREVAVLASRRESLGARLGEARSASASAVVERESLVRRLEANASEAAAAEASLAAARADVEVLESQASRAAAEAEAKAKTSADLRASLRAAEEAVAALERERDRLLASDPAASENAALAGSEASARDALAKELSRARARADAWLQAIDGESDAATRRAAARLARDRAELSAAHEREGAVASQDLARGIDLATRGADASLEARTEALDAARRAARAARDAVRQRIAACDDRLAAHRRDLQAIEGRLAGLVERDRSESATDPGLGDRPTLLERRHAAGFDVESLAALGDRAALPVVGDADEIAALARRAPTARVRLAWEGRPLADGEILPGTRLVADLAAALAWHRDTGGAAAVRGTGERVGSDGVVTLGPVGAQARAAALRRDEIASLRERLATLGREGEALEAERALVVAEEAPAVERAEASEASFHEGVAAARRESEEAIRGLRAAHDEARRAARGAFDEAIEGLRLRHDAEVSAIRDATARRRAEDREHAERALAALRESGEVRVAADLAASRSRIERLRSDRDAARLDLDARLGLARSARDAAAARLAEAEETARVAASRRAEADLGLARRRGDAEAVAARRSAAIAAGETLAASLRALDEAAGRRASEIRSLEAELEQAAAPGPDLEALATARRAAEAVEATAREAHAAAGVAQATARERLAARRAAIDETARRLEELREQARSLGVRREEIQAAATDNEATAKQAAADLEVARVARAEAWERLLRDRERAQHLRDVLRTLEEDARVHAAARDAAAREAGDLDVKAREAQVEIEGLRKRMEERYLVVLPALLDRLDTHGRVVVETDEHARADVEIGGRVHEGVPDLEIRPSHLQDYEAIATMVEDVETLRSQVAGLGDVNLAAVEEYEDVRRRHADLVAQRTDLEEACERLRDAIAKMNRTSRERFRETFDRVAENLERVYPRLTGGGRARLALTDEEDLLETGVEIFVQPPGKRLQNLALLSGGEKAMTAIAVLLSLFQVKPSPFCVLDEVDAPLDEVNGGRFNEMLREMAGLAQFIVITHNRKTMEAADTLYGITMPTPGVSRLVSVRLSA